MILKDYKHKISLHKEQKKRMVMETKDMYNKTDEIMDLFL